MAQQRADVPVPPGVGVAAENYSSSGQAGGGSGSVFGPLGGGVQHGDDLMPIQDSPRNAWGVATGNPSGGDGQAPPPLDGVFGDLGGSGVAGQTGGEAIPAAPTGRDPGGQGGM
jgi:hypothetical protein